MSQVIWNFEGKTAIVTGGSRGIGAAIVQALAKAGARVYFTYAKDVQAAKALVATCNEKTELVYAIQADFTKPADIENVMTQMEKMPIDYVINNAGLLRDRPLYKMDPEDWQQVYQVSIEALFTICKRLIPVLTKTQGNIVNIASISGISGQAGQVNYASAKAGVIGFTKSLAKEIGPMGVRINAIAPGYIETDMLKDIQDKVKKKMQRDIPLRRLGLPQEIAQSVLYTLSDAASYTTGSTLVVDGGMY
ncbi:3-oxoacyl-ACP reductase family protein [Longirhabdus pacifica]|uniref:3-oxoacyl-ACP reductase family protein n=1 Tax=Longirhabdus pacifica TaxID=2305227 RepID=UPI0010087919|nr:3-oxoacyl-ACP reductase family protein [Longirhabdus pacifica]